MPPDDKIRLSVIKGSPSDKGNIPSLDGLRAISILIVLVSHAGYGSVVPGGLGVTIFFFLSGYLITTLLMDERERLGRIHIGKFYLRRVLRLFPPLLVTLAVAYSLVWLGRLVRNDPSLPPFVFTTNAPPSATEKLNGFSPRGTYAALHKMASTEPALFDTVIVQKYASTHWSA